MSSHSPTRRAVPALVAAVALVVTGCSSSPSARSGVAVRIERRPARRRARPTATPSPTAPPAAAPDADPGTSAPLDDAPDASPTDAAEPDDAAEDAAAAGDDSHGFPDGGGGGGPAPEEPGGEGGELEPWIGPPAVCEDAPDNGAALVVTPDPVVLPSGQLTSTLALTNCADEAVDWTASTAAGIVLDAEGGSVAPAATTELGFTIDADAHEPGAVVFDVEVDEPGHTHEVTVHAFREPVAGDLVGDSRV